MKVKSAAVCLASLLQTLCLPRSPTPTTCRPQTPLDRYVKTPDSSYQWKVQSENTIDDGVKMVVVDMTSQTWRTAADVNRTEWKHWLTFAIPAELKSDVGMLFIGGGRNGSDRRPRLRTASFRSPGHRRRRRELGMVPNQPLVFHNDGRNRTEDDLIAYTWSSFWRPATRPGRSATPWSRAPSAPSTTMTALMASPTGGGRKVDRFVVAGGSSAAGRRGLPAPLTTASSASCRL